MFTDLVDIHSHLLPALDDGPEQLADAVEMATAAVAAGIAMSAATPHVRADFPAVRVEELGDRCRTFIEALRSSGVPLEVVPGAEVSLAWALDASDEQLRLATYGQLGTDVLIETPDEPAPLADLLYLLRARRFRVILAHPERNAGFQRDPDSLAPLVDQGVLLQVNADALLARRGSPRRSITEHLCRNGLAHVVASDSHRASSWRPVSSFPAGLEALAALVGERRAAWMASAAPKAILEGVGLPAAPEIETAPAPWWRFGRR